MIGGAGYAVIRSYRLITDSASSANFVPQKTADNWLHLVLAIAMIGLGVRLGRDVARRNAATD
ncbi:MAG TPA: DUF4383 domain-containing protein [Pseudonocardia sp.]